MLACLANMPVYASEIMIKMIKLHYRDAHQIQQFIEPMLAPGGKISAQGMTLLIKSTATNIIELQGIIRKIDVRPATLKISLQQAGGSYKSHSQLIKQYRTTQSNQMNQTIQVLEGHGAFISQGQEVPVLSVIRGPFWNGVMTDYRQASQGFWIVPYLRGNKVEIKIIYKNESFKPSNIKDLKNISTTVMVPLGQWRSIGGSNQSEQRQVAIYDVYQKKYTTRQSSSVMIKVDKLRN